MRGANRFPRGASTMSDEEPEDSNNRRRRRSEETQTAMTYQLEHLVEEFEGMYLMVIADAQGVMLAYAGDDDAAEMLAAQVRPLANGAKPDPELLVVMPDLEQKNILCEAINLDDIPLYLCAIMEPIPENTQAYQRARDGIQRIYYTTSELAGDQN